MITDEMIEAGCADYYTWYASAPEAVRDVARAAVRKILTAALSASPAGIPLGWWLVHDKHINALADGMAEIKATSDGRSDQPIADILTGVLAEIADAPSPIQGMAASPAGVVKPLEEGRQNYNCPCEHPSQCDDSCMSAIEPAGVKPDRQQDIEDIHKLAGMVGATFKPHEPAGVGVETDKMRRALELLIRCGEKQGWNDAYGQEMAFARAALKGDEQ